MTALRWRWKVFCSRVRQSAQILVRCPMLFTNWPYFLLSRFTTEPGTLRLRRGVTFAFRPRGSDRAMITELLLDNPYFDRALGYGIPDGPCIVVDVGANIGAFSVLVASEHPAAQVIALEPSRANYDLLKFNVRTNSLTNVRVLKAAMDATVGEQRLCGTGATASLHFGSGQGEQVTTVTLRWVMETARLDRIDFLKMDCEGAEFDILMDPAAPLDRVRMLALEFHNLSAAKCASTLKRVLEARGFRVDKLQGEWNGCLLAQRHE